MLGRLKGLWTVEQGTVSFGHVPPYFTDNSFHNLGISQVEYDRVHGDGAFQKLAIPVLQSLPDQSTSIANTWPPLRKCRRSVTGISPTPVLPICEAKAT